MYPNALKLSHIPHPLVSIDGTYLEGDMEIEIELESDAGIGDPQMTLRIGGREIMVMLDPDPALTLSEGLSFFARASKRIAEHKLEASAIDPVSGSGAVF